jgi:predicted ATPase/class 3 adenylate cyclase
LLFTDIVDSTRIAEQLGDAESARIWAEHDGRARDLLATYRGRELGRSDGLFALFDDPADAARYALAYHAALDDLPFRARAGLHVGKVSLRDNVPDAVARGAPASEAEGLAIPVTARLMALAGAGQTLVSRAARDAFALAMPAGIAIESHGHYRLKGFEDPIEVFELGEAGRAAFAPPRDIDKAYRVFREGDLWLPARDVRHNLPAERDGFVGRAADLREVAARFDDGARLVTVLGTGGTGKTRLVRRYGWTWLGDWPGGVYFVDLSDARTLEGIFFAVASALRIPLGRDDPVVQLGHAIAGRGRCLVILDNFEQIVANAAATVGRWLDVAADAGFLVTSRERLHLGGEQTLPLAPLTVDGDAVELFAMRARAHQPGFAVSPDNRDAVREIVRLLDGLPLAIELAAARIRILSPAQLVDRLRDRFTVLAGAKGVSERQSTLRRAIDWSWELLAPWEQAAFAQCSTFAGGFTLRAAESVLDLVEWPKAGPVMDVIQALADKSLLRTWTAAAQRRHDIDEPYFGMYLSLHEYAAEKLSADSARALQVEGRHGTYFARFGTEDAIDRLFERGGEKRWHALALDLENLVAACRRAVRRGDAEVAMLTYSAAGQVLALLGPYALAVALGSDVLSLSALTPAQRTAALLVQGRAMRRVGRIDEAATALVEAEALSRASSGPARRVRALLGLGELHRDQGRMDEARTLLESALAMARVAGLRRDEGIVLNGLALVHGEQSRTAEALPLFEQALAIHREVGNRHYEGVGIGNLGVAYEVLGRRDEAVRAYGEARAIHVEMGNQREVAINSAQLGHVLYMSGRVAEARAMLDDALSCVRDVGDRRIEGFVLSSLGDAAREEGDLAQARKRFEQSLAIHREVRNKRLEGSTMGSLGSVLAAQQRVNEAREAFRAGAALLRQVGDRVQLVVLLCDQGLAEHAAGDRAAASAALASAERELAAIDAATAEEPAKSVEALRRALR